MRESFMTIQPFNALSLFGTPTPSDGSPTLSTLLSRSIRPHSFATDSRGHAILPTFADLNKATNPKDKLAIAGKLAEVVQVQADAATKTGLPNRVADITAQAKKVLDAVGVIVNGLTANGSAKSGQTDPLKSYQQSLSTVLGTLHSVLAEVSALLPKATTGVAKSTGGAIRQLDLRGGVLAKQAGLVWPALTSANNSSTSRASATSNANNLVNIIA
jgi:hypothetical protein